MAGGDPVDQTADSPRKYYEEGPEEATCSTEENTDAASQIKEVKETPQEEDSQRLVPISVLLQSRRRFPQHLGWTTNSQEKMLGEHSACLFIGCVKAKISGRKLYMVRPMITHTHLLISKPETRDSTLEYESGNEASNYGSTW